MEEKVINFEEELNRLRQIVNDIQNKDISIDESLSLYIQLSDRKGSLFFLLYINV